MKRIFTSMIAVAALGLLAGGQQASQPRPFPSPVPYIGGVWYMHGDPYWPCEIVQRRLDGQALFINERGDSAWGTVQGNRVWVPDWSDGRTQGLEGRIRGDRIIWRNGTFWVRGRLPREFDNGYRFQNSSAVVALSTGGLGLL